ncbi:hypothetical protein ACFL2A_05140 [Thermodesulfobacteriota bacterium]
MPDQIISGFFTAAGVPLDHVLKRTGGVTPSADPKVCEYQHFDLSTDSLGSTIRYNCWGFTFMPRRYWLGRHDVDDLLRDNCNPVANGSLQVGDVIRYRNNDITTHTGRVWQVDGSGNAVMIRSKWGPSPEYMHVPLDVPASYGTELAYFRQHAPIRGDVSETNKIAELWIKDSPGDDGEQYSGAPWWTSPDILVDVPPYDGSPDINPVFDHPNRVWALVRNRTNQSVDNVKVRYYWANPSAGLAPANWNLIPGTIAHPNPTGPISINGNSSVSADFVEWTPTAAPAHQCLLAIAYIDDDPQNSENPDPLVYPFNIPWDNNIAQRNVHVVEAEAGGNSEFSISVGTPFNEKRKFKGSINAVLTYSPRLSILGFPEKMVPLKVKFLLDKKQKAVLTSCKECLKESAEFIPKDKCSREKPIASMVLPSLTFVPEKAHQLNVSITVPKNAKKGSAYHLHIAQTISNSVTGGYTAVIIIV